jgi:hypothetical protein
MFMRGSLNFQEVHQGYWGAISLLEVFNDFKLEWAMIGAHGREGLFLFWNLILD